MQSPQMHTPGTHIPPNERQTTAQIHDMLRDVRDRARQNLATVQNPKVEALLETTAEVLQGLMTAYEDFDKGQEKAWQ